MPLRPILTALAALALCACARAPAPELLTYTQSFEEARAAGGALLDELAPLVPAAAGDGPDACAPDPVTGFRPCFTPALALGAATPDAAPEIALRRAALDAIAGYNRLLGDMAAGGSATALGARIDALTQVASAATALLDASAAPATAVLIAPIRDLGVKVERMRAQSVAADAVLAAEPDIRALIRLMIADTPALYGLYVADIINARGDARIAAARAAITGEVVQTPDHAEKARRFEAALIAYVRLLDQADRALSTLTAAIRAPAADPVAMAAMVVEQATEARVLAAQFHAEIRALNAR